MTERRVCIICNEHRVEQGDFCARCWAEYTDDIRRDSAWIVELRQAAKRKNESRKHAARGTRPRNRE